VTRAPNPWESNPYTERMLGQILVSIGAIDEARLSVALDEQQRRGGKLGRLLVDLRFVTEDAVTEALGRQLKIPIVALDEIEVPQAVTALLSREECENNSLFPVRADERFLDLVMADPQLPDVLDAVRVRTRRNIRVYLAGPKAIERAIRRHYAGLAAPVTGVHETFGLQLEMTDSGKVRLDELAEQLSPPEATYDEAKAWSTAAQAPVPLAPIVPSPRPADEVVLLRGRLTQLEARVGQLEALLGRDEDVIRKLMGLLIGAGVFTRDQLVERIRQR